MRPHELSATAAAAAIRDGRLSSEELVRDCLDRIAARDEQVRAWVHLDPERALAEAGARDASGPDGPLHGVPVGVKDLIDTADLPTQYGSPIYAGNRPASDAACVARLREAGAVVLGKTVTTEFALFHPGPTRNPHDLARTPGGSSSGSAAAVADQMVPFALGTQTAGSVVRPAIFCGVFGFKPTFGLVPTDGVKAIAPSLDTVGVLARSVDDLAVGAAVMAGRPTADFEAASPERPRIGFVRTHEWERADAATRSTLERLVADLAGSADVDEPEFPPEFDSLVEAQQMLMGAEASESLAVEHRRHTDRISETLRGVLDLGATRGWTRQAAIDLAVRCRERLGEMARDYDFLLAPAVVGEAPEGIDATGDPLFCRLWTLLGTPAVAVPGLRGPNGLPLGVQVLAPVGGDAAALAGARWLADRLGVVEATV